MNIKQVVVTGQNQVELQDMELDENLGKDELLIKTEYTFISTGTELANYTGKEPRVFQAGSWCAYPWKSGYSNVGIVSAVGEGVTAAKIGQRVFTNGPHASMIRTSQKNFLIEVPDEIDPEIAAASRMAAVATTAIIISEIPQNSWVVVFGLGPVGNLAAQAFNILGCKVIGVDPTRYRCELAEKSGIPYTISGNEQEVFESIKKITGGRMSNITVDAVGHSKVVLQGLKCTANYGQMILLGSPRVPVEGNLTELLSDIHLRWITLRGGLEWCLPTYSDFPGRESLYSKQQMIFDWIERGKLKIEPLISHHLKPEQIKDAYDGLLNYPEKYTGVVLDWN